MTMKCQENQYEKPILNLDQSNHLLIICFDGNQNNERKFCFGLGKSTKYTIEKKTESKFSSLQSILRSV